MTTTKSRSFNSNGPPTQKYNPLFLSYRLLQFLFKSYELRPKGTWDDASVFYIERVLHYFLPILVATKTRGNSSIDTIDDDDIDAFYRALEFLMEFEYVQLVDVDSIQIIINN